MLRTEYKKKGKKMKKKTTKFTLVEILTVAAIISVLIGMSLGITAYVGKRNREVQTQTTIKMLEMVLEQYKNKHGYYPALSGKPEDDIGNAVFKLPATPPDNHELVSLFHDVSYNNNDITGIKGVNVKRVGNDIFILDGWGAPILYVYPGVFNKTKVDLVSGGPDKKLGDEKSSVLEIKSNGDLSPDVGSRSSGVYYEHAGKGDDITNFKRTDN